MRTGFACTRNAILAVLVAVSLAIPLPRDTWAGPSWIGIDPQDKGAIEAMAPYFAASNPRLINDALADCGFRGKEHYADWAHFSSIERIVIAYLNAEQSGLTRGAVLLAHTAEQVERRYPNFATVRAKHPVLAPTAEHITWAPSLIPASALKTRGATSMHPKHKAAVLALADFLSDASALSVTSLLHEAGLELEAIFRIRLKERSISGALLAGLASLPPNHRRHAVVAMSHRVVSTYPAVFTRKEIQTLLVRADRRANARLRAGVKIMIESGEAKKLNRVLEREMPRLLEISPQPLTLDALAANCTGCTELQRSFLVAVLGEKTWQHLQNALVTRQSINKKSSPAFILGSSGEAIPPLERPAFELGSSRDALPLSERPAFELGSSRDALDPSKRAALSLQPHAPLSLGQTAWQGKDEKLRDRLTIALIEFREQPTEENLNRVVNCILLLTADPSTNADLIRAKIMDPERIRGLLDPLGMRIQPQSLTEISRTARQIHRGSNHAMPHPHFRGR